MNITNLKELEKQEFIRQDNTLNFIASENYCSEDVLNANSSIFINKYAEGFCRNNKRYYQGCSVVDMVEQQAEEECLKMLNAEENYNVNVQFSSGCQANITVYHALLKSGDTVLAPDTASLGHISHGIKGSFLDTYFTVQKYGLNENNVLDYDEIERIALICKPKLIICGASNYNKQIDFKRFREIADKVDAILMGDVSHILGLIVTGNHPSPVNYCHIITSTLHKTLRGTRGAIVVYNKEFDKQIKYSIIPGLWGGSHVNNTLAKLYSFKEAQTDIFCDYIKQSLLNTKTMCEVFIKNDIPVVGGETENHLFCLDLTNYTNGKDIAVLLEDCGIVVNANAIPNDTSFIKPHGVRIGCAPVTSRGLKEDECKHIAQHISDIIMLYKDNKIPDDKTLEKHKNILRCHVEYLCNKYPFKFIYPNMYNRLFQSEV